MSKKYFEAIGRQTRSLGRSISSNRLNRQSWPKWAREAYARGWISQCPRNPTSRTGADI